MIETTTSADGQVLLLLCSRLGLPSDTKPLGLGEWNLVAAAMARTGLGRPSALLGKPAARLVSELGVQAELADRMAALLSRGGQLALELDRLSSRGIWTVTRADAEYPARLKTRLKQQAPPVLFGAGAPSSMIRGGLAVVGSRDVDEPGLEFARRLARSCADARLVVVSGGARGTDLVAQEEALDAGGSVLAVVADSLERALQKRTVLAPVRAGRLTLLTPFHPATPFSVGTAMGRNRLLYCLSDGAVVVSSAAGEGGTWAGALENLERGWVALHVRTGPNVPEGNLELVNKGGRPLRIEQVASAAALQAILDTVAFPFEPRAAEHLPMARDALFGSPASEEESAAEESLEASQAIAPSPERQLGDVVDVYTLVIDRLTAFCHEPRTADEIASAFAIERTQTKSWLMRALTEGVLQKRAKPVRYVAAKRTLFTS